MRHTRGQATIAFYTDDGKNGKRFGLRIHVLFFDQICRLCTFRFPFFSNPRWQPRGQGSCHFSSAPFFVLSLRCSEAHNTMLIARANLCRKWGKMRQNASMPELQPLHAMMGDDDDSDDMTPPDRTRDPHDTRNPHTIGAEGSASPRAIAKLGELHWFLREAPISVQPFVETSVMDSKVYVMIWWRPEEPGGIPLRGMMRPHLWHTTLTVAYINDLLSVEFARFFESLQLRINALWIDILAELQSTDTLYVTRAPWAKSWNFGIGMPWEYVCSCIQNFADLVTTQNPTVVVLRTRRDLHISWQ